MDGALARTTSTFGAGHTLEFAATFSGNAHQHGGLGEDFNNGVWAKFSTFGGGGLYARTANGLGSIDTFIPGTWTGASHVFRIERQPTVVNYFIDGVQVASHVMGIANPLRLAFSDFTTGGGSVRVEWVRLKPYVTPGTFTSRIFDAGTVVTWDNMDWSLTTPTGTTIALSVPWAIRRFQTGRGPTGCRERNRGRRWAAPPVICSIGQFLPPRI